MTYPNSIDVGSALRRDDGLLFTVENMLFWSDVYSGHVRDQVKWLWGGGSCPMEFIGQSGHRYLLEVRPHEHSCALLMSTCIVDEYEVLTALKVVERPDN